MILRRIGERAGDDEAGGWDPLVLDPNSGTLSVICPDCGARYFGEISRPRRDGDVELSPEGWIAHLAQNARAALAAECPRHAEDLAL